MTAARLGWRTIRASCVAYVTIASLSWLYCYGIPWLKVHNAMKGA